MPMRRITVHKKRLEEQGYVPVYYKENNYGASHFNKKFTVYSDNPTSGKVLNRIIDKYLASNLDLIALILKKARYDRVKSRTQARKKIYCSLNVIARS